MLGDEVPARSYGVSHEGGEEAVGTRSVVDRDQTDEGGAGGRCLGSPMVKSAWFESVQEVMIIGKAFIGW